MQWSLLDKNYLQKALYYSVRYMFKCDYIIYIRSDPNVIKLFAITGTVISFNNMAHIQGQILKYIQGSNCELTARAACEMPTASMGCESLNNSLH